jgi:predicted nucleic acid-binding protein
MPNHVLCDTSCLIILEKIGGLHLLQKLYSEVFITSDVLEEYGEGLPSWIIVRTVKNNQTQQILELQLDKGESSIIALALETDADLIILDDLKARKIANGLKLKVTGTLGILLKSKKNGSTVSLREWIERMEAHKFYLKEDLKREALKLAGE